MQNWHTDEGCSILQTLLPLLACGISLLVLSCVSIQQKSRWKGQAHHKLLVGDTSVEDEVAGDDDESVADLTVQRAITRTNVSTREVDKPTGEVGLVAVEVVALAGQLGLSLTSLINALRNNEKEIMKTSIAGLLSWGYMMALAAVRLFSSTTKWHANLGIWNHTAILYGAQWLFEVVVFRSAIIHPRSGLSRALNITEFALSNLLVLVVLVSRKGNRAVVLEYENDLEPSHEPLASVLSLASFSWVDSVVWLGYKKTLELSDVWSLNPQDKATSVLADFRQMKKTHGLALRLLFFFKRKVLIQGAWAMLSSIFMFLPTLLLKAILEYIEDPQDTSRNAAWLPVILLLFTGLVRAVSDGQALWIGRKVCIRLRAVIIGEIYSKALRRRAAAGTEKQLGKEEDDQPQALKKKILSLGGKKNAQAKTQGDLGIPKDSDAQTNNGTIINLMSIDSFKVSDICAYLHYLWAQVPVQLAMAITLLYRILGFSSFVGIVLMVFILPMNLLIARSFQRAQKQIMSATDNRIQSTNEVLQNIRIIKYFAWEQRFSNDVNEKRRTELKALRWRYILWSLAATIWSGVPIIITFTSFLIYTVIEKKALVPSVAFPALSMFSLLRIPLDQLADMVAHVQEAKVSVDRVDEFLNEEETEKYMQIRESKKRRDDVPRIALEHATLSWGAKNDPISRESTDAFRLINMDVSFEIGRLNIIAGPTGSGKTSLLMALLGEMRLLEGNVLLPGGSVRQDLPPDPETRLTESVAYCAQQAWLVNDTIKENILFASPFDERRYEEAIGVCALERDLEILDAGDQTLVGEKGIALSGGQKQRISLARAIYCNSKHLLLDDCLSAVDSHTAKHIFEKAIMGQLMVGRTCVLVTHNLSLTVPRSRYVVVLENGKIVEQGPPEYVVSSGALGEETSKSRPGSRVNSTAPSRVPSDLEQQRSHLSGSTMPYSRANGGVAKGNKKDKKIVDTRIEAKAQGRIKGTTIKMYLSAMGPWYFWLAAAVAFIGSQVASVATNVWIRQWANSYYVSSYDPKHSLVNLVYRPASSSANTAFGAALSQMPQTSSRAMNISGALANPDVDVTYYLGVYALIGVVYVLVTFGREILLFSGGLHASWHLHSRLLHGVMRAKFKFFDSTPLGQLLNRFSKDIQSVDQEVAPVAIGMVHSLASVVTIVILITVITPGFLIAGFFISCMYFATGFFYIHSSRDLKRIESVQRSPLFQAFGEMLSGVVTIRAYGDESRFIGENHNRINTHNRPFIYLWATNRWLAFRVDVAGALVAFFSGVFVIANVGRIDAGAAGLALSYAITFTENVLWLVRLYAANEQNMNAVERVKEYIEVDQEARAEIPETKPAANWPSRGAIEFIGYSTRYRADLDPVLRRLSFSVKAGEKVGIVGRTGAGKSSLALALFRGLEAEEGKIVIDDVDIGLIGLQDLREAITIVPQDPTLFTGSTRSNLDPFGLFTDEEIFTALQRVQLISGTKPIADDSASGTSSPAASSRDATLSASSTPPGGTLASSSSEAATLVRFASNSRENKNVFHKLSSPISESGANLSQGQRQLLCLARALLKSPRVLLMDEATASIDYATDSKIQETLRELKNNTIITIAHRLQTIIDYDKVLVLDNGELVEYDDPWNLIKKENGAFRRMCEISGDIDALSDVAKLAWEKRRLIDDS